MGHVLLVNPNKVQYSCEEGDISGGEVSPPLGLMSLGGALREKGHQVRMFDRQTTEGESVLSRELDEYAKDLQGGATPDIVGITCVTPFRSDAKAFIAKTREIYPPAVIVVGGPDATFARKEYLTPGWADIAVLGEGELTLLALADGVEPSTIPGLAYMKNGNILRTGAPAAADLNKLPFPARDLVKLDRYPKEVASMISSRGCSYHCAFCCSREFWGDNVRTRSPKKIADEIELLYRDYGYNMIRHHDDNWAYRSEAFISDLRDELKNRGLIGRVTHEVETSPVTLNETKISLMKDMGINAVWISMETAQPHLLKYLKKPYLIDNVERAVQLLRAEDIAVGLYVIFGMPDETYEQAKETVDKVWALQPAYVGASILTAYPGTSLYRGEPPGEDLGNLFPSLAGWAHWGNYLGEKMTAYELLKVFAYAYHKLGKRLGNSYRLSKMFQVDQGLTEVIADMHQPWRKRLERWLQLKTNIREEAEDAKRAALEAAYEYLGHKIINEPIESRFREIARQEFRGDDIGCGDSRGAKGPDEFVDLREKAYRSLVARVINIAYFAEVKTRLTAYRDAVVTGKENTQVDLFKEIVSGLWPQNRGRDCVMKLFSGGHRSEWLLTGLGFRKHFLHQCQVFLVGSYIIAELQDSMEQSAEARLLGLTSENLYHTWMMASVLHDIGLSIGTRLEVNKELASIDQTLGLEKPAKSYEPQTSHDYLRKVTIKTSTGGTKTIDLLGFLQSWFSRNDILKEGIIEQEFEKGNHGILGALVMLRTLIPFLQETYDLAATADTLLIEKEKELGNAAAAIAVHNLSIESFSKQLSFKDYPVLFLLRLTDELDEEKRMTGDTEERPDLCLSAVGRRINNAEKEIELVLTPWAHPTDDKSVGRKAIEDKVRKQCEEARKWLKLGSLTESELPGCAHNVAVVATLALEERCELVRMSIIRIA